jgi:dTDP-D-glucose 4,6-dehydratase
LNWEPQFDLEVGIQRTVQWYKDFLSVPERTFVTNS